MSPIFAYSIFGILALAFIIYIICENIYLMIRQKKLRKKADRIEKAIRLIVGVKPESSKEKTLEELVKGITPQNRHVEVDFGLAAGKELI